MRRYFVCHQCTNVYLFYQREKKGVEIHRHRTAWQVFKLNRESLKMRRIRRKNYKQIKTYIVSCCWITRGVRSFIYEFFNFPIFFCYFLLFLSQSTYLNGFHEYIKIFTKCLRNLFEILCVLRKFSHKRVQDALILILWAQKENWEKC